MRSQIGVERIAPQLLEFASQPQALKLAFSFDFNVTHGAPPGKESSHRTRCGALSVAHTTDCRFFRSV